MARMIDADEFKHEISAMAIKNNYPADKANALCKIIDRQPAVDAEPVRYGRWIKSGISSGKCSECGEISVDIGKYCSNCGAKMEECENE